MPLNFEQCFFLEILHGMFKKCGRACDALNCLECLAPWKEYWKVWLFDLGILCLFVFVCVTGEWTVQFLVGGGYTFFFVGESTRVHEQGETDRSHNA